MKVKKDWWKDFFNETYLVTDKRSVGNPILTRKEVDILEKVLNLERGDKILDLCGGSGRHSLELARRGYSDITVLDFSDFLIKKGKKEAKALGFNIRFIRRDARFNRLKGNSFSTIFIMANSFGYFKDERENFRVLQECRRLLKRSGRLLLDLADPDYVRNNLKPLSWHEADSDIIVCRERNIRRDIIKAREIVISKKKGLIRDGRYSERIYDKDKIDRLLRKAGFKDLSLRNNISLHIKKSDYGLLGSRMIVTAVRK